MERIKMAKTNLKEANTVVTVEGMLAENNLELATDSQGESVIKGSLVIQTGECNFITFEVYTAQHKKDASGNYTKETNKVFKSLETVMNEYQSIASVGADEATCVRVSKGQIRPNSYIADDDTVRTSTRYSANFFNRIEKDKMAPEAQFACEVYIEKIYPEVHTDEDKRGEETGRAIIKGWMPTYSGIEPITLVIQAEEGVASAALETFSTRQVIKKMVPVAIGKPKEETTTVYKNELLVFGATTPYSEDENGQKPYDAEAIKLAVVEMEKNLRAKKEKSGGNSESETPKKPKSSDRKLPW